MPDDNTKTVNFQIQYFPEEKKNEFKEMAHSAGLSMKELLLVIIANKRNILKAIQK